MNSTIIEYRSRIHMKRLYTDASYAILEGMIPDDLKGLWFLKNPDEKVYGALSDVTPFTLHVPKNVHYIRVTENEVMVHSITKKYKTPVKHNQKGFIIKIQEMIDYIAKECIK